MDNGHGHWTTCSKNIAVEVENMITENNIRNVPKECNLDSVEGVTDDLAC